TTISNTQSRSTNERDYSHSKHTSTAIASNYTISNSLYHMKSSTLKLTNSSPKRQYRACLEIHQFLTKSKKNEK
ncbi:hypothetical protein VIGAN_01419300, partial [Vigna angularis var. angularis]